MKKMNDSQKREQDLSKDMFEFVQAEQKIYDKKFQTKPVGYFKDAMIRFSKNKTNVVATVILGIIVILSIFLPIFSNKNAEALESQVAFLPPRIPLLEDIGIADGHKKVKDQPVDMTNIDEETGLYLPITIPLQYIDMDTLTNYEIECTDTDEACIGGQNDIKLDPTSQTVTISSDDFVTFNALTETVLKINVTDFGTMDGSTKLLVQLVPGFGDYKTVYTITEPGEYEITPYDALGAQFAVSKIRLTFESEVVNNTVQIDTINVYDNTQDAPIYTASGYDLSQYSIVDGAGALLRNGGIRTVAAFSYDAYGLAFGDKEETAFSSIEYNQLMQEYADVCVQSPDPDNPNGWIFSEGCPITKVIKKNESVVVNGVEYYSYNLILNYAIYSGYDSIPYYYFGTTASGRDLAKLMFLGTRTSLTIGLIVGVINISIGIVYGAVSGYYGGQVDIIMQRFTEIMGRLPWLVTLSIFLALIGPGAKTLILILIINGWVGVAAITRTQFYRYKGREYVLASRTLGAKDGRLIFRHILPNGIGTIITLSILSIPYVIFTEATLSYLGFGIGHGQSLNILGLELSGVSIGVLLSDGRSQLYQNPYLTLFPALIISILMITFNMFGNALRDAFNPALRGSE